MTHIITEICLRDGGCAEVCPVECIIPGKPQEEWPLYYIDRDTCIDCGACVPECPWEAIFPEEDVPSDYVGKGTIKVRGSDLAQRINKPVGTPGFDQVYDGVNGQGEAVHLEGTRILKKGEVVDLTPGTALNDAFFQGGPGYSAKD